MSAENGGEPKVVKLGMVAGVFTPSVLTILGAIMYLREGWVVGNAGLLGAVVIILLAHVITIPTGLAVASIATNIRVGAGGAYAIITQSLGLEAGGSIGIPLYLARTVSVVLYVLAFAEGWQRIFPEHDFRLVSVVTLLVSCLIAFVSTSFAARTQIVIMAVIALSLVSIALGAFPHEVQVEGQAVLRAGAVHHPTWWGEFAEHDFWTTFAIFFPAVTGIVAGISLSDVLAEPRRAIPVGILSALAVTLAVYLALAWWLSVMASPAELLADKTILVDRARWSWAVLAGLLGATFSSALGSIMAAPRVLMAMGANRIVPWSSWFAQETKRGEPRNAMLVTSALSFVTLFVALLGGGLDFIAPLITMFFLLTYGMLNMVVLIEQSLDMVSFRPTFRIPRAFPILGLASCALVMFLVNPLFSLFSAILAIGVYAHLTQAKLGTTAEGDVRSGLFLSIAKWAAQKVSRIPAAPERAWQPNVLAAVESRDELLGSFRLLRSLTRTQGSVTVVGVVPRGDEEEKSLEGLEALARDFRDDGIYARTTRVHDQESFLSGVRSSGELLHATIFRPNVLFLRLLPGRDLGDLADLAGWCTGRGMGLVLLARHPVQDLGRERRINVWIREQGPQWKLGLRLSNLDLMILLAYQLARNWEGRVHLIMAVPDAETGARAETYLGDLIRLARLGDWAEAHVHVGSFEAALDVIERGDVSLLGLPPRPEAAAIQAMTEKLDGSILFVRDAGNESVLA